MFFAVLGSGGVGKSAVTLRYVRDFFVKVGRPAARDGKAITAETDHSLVARFRTLIERRRGAEMGSHNRGCVPEDDPN